MVIHPIYTTLYYPQCNGIVERLDHTIANMLSIFTDRAQRTWDLLVHHVTFAYKTAVHITIKLSPFLFYRQKQNVKCTSKQVLAARSLAVDNIHSRQQQDKTRYDAEQT